MTTINNETKINKGNTNNDTVEKQKNQKATKSVIPLTTTITIIITIIMIRLRMIQSKQRPP